jgi:sugar/nucleoside kinase (ribokinase family)
MSILVVGSVAIDSLKTPFGSRKESLGGSATFFSMAARFFNKVDIVATVGKDFPDRYFALFDRKGIGTGGLHVTDGKTFRWKGWYGDDLSTAHTVYTRLNVFKDFKPDIPKALRRPKSLFLANINPELQLDVLRQVWHPGFVACDSMNLWIETKRASLLRLLRRVDMALLNEAEARQLTGEPNLVHAARSILAMGPGSVVIKKGEHGAMYFSRSDRFALAAYLLEKVCDPTGAGDTFAGGMVGYLSSLKKIDACSVRRAIAYGTVLASFTVEGFGVERLAGIAAGDIRRRYEDFRKMTRF